MPKMQAKTDKLISAGVELPRVINSYVSGPLNTSWTGILTALPVHKVADRKHYGEHFDPHTCEAIETQMNDHLFSANEGEARLLHIKGQRVVLIGLGNHSNDRSILRWAGARAAQVAREMRRPILVLDRGTIPAGSWPAAAADMAEGAELGSFTFQHYKKQSSRHQTTGDGLRLHFVDQASSARFSTAIHSAVTCASAANFARHLANHPPNAINPTTLVQLCRKLAKECGLACKIITFAEAQRLSMGGLCSVGQGSPNKPALIILEHKPAGSRSKRPIAVVGKAVTFDTGGISIKPAADMGAMKYDKCGGMAAIGVAAAAAMLKLPRHIVCAVPTAENMVDGGAYRPGDIIRMYNAKTVDVTNTDAEGRLILADAISYVCRHYKPSVLIDLATLTGGVITALGGVYAGLMSNNDELASQLITAGVATDEWLWRLPLNPRYRKLLDSPHADMVNSGGREAHPIQGGMFLQEFVPAGTPWAHLDIAGVSHPKKEYRYLKGEQASGFGVRLLVEFIKSCG